MILMMSKLSSVLSSSSSMAEDEDVVGYLSDNEGLLATASLPLDRGRLTEPGLDWFEVVSQPMKANRGGSAVQSAAAAVAPVSDTDDDADGDDDDGGSSKLADDEDLVVCAPATMTPTLSRILAREMLLDCCFITSKSESVEEVLKLHSLLRLLRLIL